MMMPLFLLDVRPDPPSAAIGLSVLIVLVLAIAFISTVLIGGFVLLMVRRKRRQSFAGAEAAGAGRLATDEH
jgi:hypothetical protein